MGPDYLMNIPFLELKSGYLEFKEEFDAAYHRFMESGLYVLGDEVAAFETEYAAYCQSSHCVGVGHGLDALHLALRALGVGPSDEVIVPSNTYIATWLAVTQAGATNVPVEPDPLTFNIDPSRIEESITKNTKAILAVNLYGQPCDYDAILDIAQRYGLKVAIDNAQAQGARYKGRKVGGIADIECHSFYPSKNLGAFGEAGAITTNDETLADKIRVLRNYGSRVRYYNEVQGYNSRLDALQAAFLRVKLRYLDEWNARRSKLAQEYLTRLSSLDTRIVLPSVPSWADPVWHLFVIRHPERDALQKHLVDRGIQTLIHYPVPAHLSGAYASEFQMPDSNFPIAESLASEVLSLPIGAHMTEDQVGLVVDAVQSFPN